MPTITFELKDLSKLVGKTIKADDIDDLALYAKAEFEGYDKTTDTVTLSMADTNVPYLWSVEGFARLLRGVLGKEKGIPHLPIQHGKKEVLVDASVKKVRPCLSCFIAKGSIDEAILKQLIQLQEKLADSYGRRRRKASIGIYRSSHIAFPVTYKADLPAKIVFCPLEFTKEMNAKQILVEHPTGKKYSFTLTDETKYPVLVDAKGKVLSLVPIINSNDLGKVQVGDKEIMVEVTGTDEETVQIIALILAYAFSDRGFSLEGMLVRDGKKNVQTPIIREETCTITLEHVQSVLGLSLSKQDVTTMLQKMRYDVKGLTVHIPPYRADILHPVDIAEDIGVMHGYDHFPTTQMATYTPGEPNQLICFVDKVRDILVGSGFQEVMSAVLSNKQLLYNQMSITDSGTVEIKEYMSETYSVVRSWLLPILMDTLSKNKHHDYPQNIFEQGIVTTRKGKDTPDSEHLAFVICEPDATYTKARQVLDAILAAFGCTATYKETEHGSFIPGRAASVTVGKKDVAIVGEVSPVVLTNFGMAMPAAAVEINLTELFEKIK